MRHVVREQGCFFLDTPPPRRLEDHPVGASRPPSRIWSGKRALIPLVVEEGGHDTIGGKQTAHATCERLCEGRDERVTRFQHRVPANHIIEKNELFQLQRASTLEALCGGNIATESINHIVSARMAQAMEKHYGVPRAALDFYHEHMEVEEDHRDRALAILARVAVTDEEQTRGMLALRRAITARRICADGMYEAFVAR